MNEVDRVMDHFYTELAEENLALQQRIKTLELQLSIVTGDRAGLVEKLAEAYDSIALLADDPDKELVLVLRIANDTSVVRHTYQMWGDIHSMNDMSWALNTIFLQDGVAASAFVYTKSQWQALAESGNAKWPVV